MMKKKFLPFCLPIVCALSFVTPLSLWGMDPEQPQELSYLGPLCAYDRVQTQRHFHGLVTLYDLITEAVRTWPVSLELPPLKAHELDRQMFPLDLNGLDYHVAPYIDQLNNGGGALGPDQFKERIKNILQDKENDVKRNSNLTICVNRSLVRVLTQATQAICEQNDLTNELTQTRGERDVLQAKLNWCSSGVAFLGTVGVLYYLWINHLLPPNAFSDFCSVLFPPGGSAGSWRLCSNGTGNASFIWQGGGGAPYVGGVSVDLLVAQPDSQPTLLSVPEKGPSPHASSDGDGLAMCWRNATPSYPNAFCSWPLASASESPRVVEWQAVPENLSGAFFSIPLSDFPGQNASQQHIGSSSGQTIVWPGGEEVGNPQGIFGPEVFDLDKWFWPTDVPSMS